ncbi:MAG TPA: hypothetical protein ENJ31_01615 [Anaerolineae bacterium]|nr:hypothetical protein [Anaerolineae bacterium]
MAEYSGKDLVVTFNSIDISGQGRRVSIEEKSDPPERYDVTHRGDTQKQTLEGLPGAVSVTVQFSCLDESGGTANLLDFSIGDQHDLVIYPEGNSSGNPMITVTDATLVSRNNPIEYNKPVELEATFESSVAVTRGTVP